MDRLPVRYAETPVAGESEHRYLAY